MKKIFLLLILTLLLTSCFGQEKKVINKVENKVENKEKIDELALKDNIKKKSILSHVPENDIRKETKYPINFTGIQNKYFNNNKDIGLLLSYIGNMEYQGYLETKEKEYSEIIIKMGEEFLKQAPNNIKLKGFKKNILIPRLLEKIGNSYEILGENEKALISYQKSISINFNEYKTYIDLGNLYKKLGKDNKSKEIFDKAKDFIKTSNKIEEINKSFEKFENNYGGYIDLGIIYKLLGDNKKSNENFDKAEDIIKNNKNIYINEYENRKTLFNFNKIKNN